MRSLTILLCLLLAAANAWVVPFKPRFEARTVIAAVSEVLGHGRKLHERQTPSSNPQDTSRRPNVQTTPVELVDALAIIASGTLNQSSPAFIEARVDIINEGNATTLFPRQAEEIEPGVAGCNAVCAVSTCGTGLCPLTKRGLEGFRGASWLASDDLLEVNATKALHKRQFPDEDLDLNDPTSIENYLRSREDTPGALDVLGRTDFDAEDEWSFARTERFVNYQEMPLVINSGQLTGCTAVIVASRTAVYFGHWWQPLGWETHRGRGQRHNFQQNVANLITGSTPLFRASGTSLDPELFPADESVAVIMTPRRGNPNPRLYYQTNVNNLADIIRNRIGVTAIVYGYNPPRGNAALERRPRQGNALFEYEWDADGQGNGNWRIWTEENQPRDGGGQLIQGRNRPTYPFENQAQG